MAFLRKLDMSRTRIATLLIIVVIVASSIVYTDRDAQSKDQIQLLAIIVVDKEIVRAGESINFSAESSTGAIDAFLWRFGDGRISDDVAPSHSYESPGYYDVQLKVTDAKGRSNISNVRVGVQLADSSMIATDDNPVWVFRREHATSLSTFASVGPNIGWPVVEGRIEIIRPIGQFEIAIDLQYYDYITDHHCQVDLFYQSVASPGADIDLPINLDMGILPKEWCAFTAELYINVMLEQNAYSQAQITANIAFPMDPPDEM